MGTVVAKQMGLPVSRILCGVNENKEFPDFLETGKYVVTASKKSPSSAMIVSHPSNLARLIDLYNGHMYDERDSITKKVIREGVIDKMPDLELMRKDLWSVSISNSQHYSTMKEVYSKYGVILDPHGSVGWKTLELYTKTKFDSLSVIYETADPGKFPLDVKQAIGFEPPLPIGMKNQLSLQERIYSINSTSLSTPKGLKLTDEQVKEAKQKIAEIFSL
jgi:threonine synthase